MSRFTIRLPNKVRVVYGLDHALGWFFDKIQVNAPEEEDTILEESCTLFTGLSGPRLAEKLTELKAPAEHIDRILMDLDPQVA